MLEGLLSNGPSGSVFVELRLLFPDIGAKGVTAASPSPSLFCVVSKLVKSNKRYAFAQRAADRSRICVGRDADCLVLEAMRSGTPLALAI
jgi:hypothetical protein